MTSTVIREDAAKSSSPAAKGKAAPGQKSFLKSKKGIICIVVALVVAFAGYKFLMPKKVAPPAAGDVVSIPATTLNLDGGHYLKIAVDIELVKGKASLGDFKVSNAEQLIIDEYSDRTVASLSTNTARTALETELSAKIKKAYPGEVFEIFLTQFVTQ